MKKLFLIIAAAISTILAGCASYHISATSLSDQLTGNTVSKGYLLATNAVKGNDLTSVKCLDKNGKEKEIAVTYRTGVRITRSDNFTATFYFNTLLIKDSAIIGSKTHFFNDKVKPIKLSDIVKIEIME